MSAVSTREQIHQGLAAARSAPGWLIFMRSVRGRAYPRVVGMLREPSWMFFEILLPLLATSAYVLVYEALQAPESFKGFVLLGGAMTAFWINVLWMMAMQLYWDKEQGNLQLYLISPAPLMAILLGMAIGGIVATCLRAFAILLVGAVLFGISYPLNSLPAVSVVFVLTLAGLYGLGMLLASVFLVYSRGAWQVSAIIQEGVNLISGFYFPVRSLGLLAAGLGSILPLTLGLDAMRQLLYPKMGHMAFLPVVVEIAILAVLAVVFIAGAYGALRLMEHRSRRDGRITERGN